MRSIKSNYCYRSFLAAAFFFIFLLLCCFHSAHASLADDLIAREGWRKISLDFEGASLLNILKIFSQQSGLNFIASPGLSQKKVTLYLENVPLREALEKILNANQLTYDLDEDSNIFIVKERFEPDIELLTKVFKINYAPLSNSPINAGGGVRSGLVEAVQQRLSKNGKMTEDTRTNSLIITDVPFALKEIERAIQELDVPIPQVMIEVEIIDTTKGVTDNLGFSWTVGDNLFRYTLPAFRPYHTSSNPLSNTVGGAGQVAMGGEGDEFGLRALRTHSDSKILARPKILTLSNEKAEIKITDDAVIGTVSSFDNDGNLSSQSAERAEIGVDLTVTPSVNIETGEITMLIEPRVTSTAGSTFYDENNNRFQNPQERSAKIKVVAKNNQTIVIGGLLREDFTQGTSKVPFLGDIPFLGALFRHKNKEKDEDREMLVFITPRIIAPTGVDYAYSPKAEYNQEILVQREQADYSTRKEEIDKALGAWDNY